MVDFVSIILYSSQLHGSTQKGEIIIQLITGGPRLPTAVGARTASAKQLIVKHNDLAT